MEILSQMGTEQNKKFKVLSVKHCKIWSLLATDNCIHYNDDNTTGCKCKRSLF